MLTRQLRFNAVCDAAQVSVVNVDNNVTYFTVPVADVIALGLSPSGTVVVVATCVDNTGTYITAYEPDRNIRCRIVLPFFVKAVAVNNTVSAVGIVIATDELPYDIVLVYNVKLDKMFSVYHGATVAHLRFCTNNLLMINSGFVFVDA